MAAPLRCKNCLVLHCHIFRPCPGVCLLLPVGCSSTCPVFGVLRLHPSAAGAMLAPSPHASPAETQALLGCWALGLCVCVLRGGGQTRTGSLDGDERPGVPGSTSGCHTGAQGQGAAPTPLSLQFRHSQHGAHRTTPPIPSPARHTQDGSSQRSDPAPHVPSSD